MAASILLLACLLTACAPRVISSAPPTRTPSAQQPASTLAERILATAKSQVGTAYCYAGASPEEGFDCSGLVAWAFARHGIKLPRTTDQQFAVGTPVAYHELRPADLVFFRQTYDRKRLHVGIYVGEGRSLMIHSPKAGARVQLVSLLEDHWQSHWVGGRRVLSP